MASRLQPVRINSLIPNVTNPRHAEVESPQSAVAALMQKMPRKILALARDISSFGLDPSSLPIVVEEGEFFVALEGNRRVAALLLIHNPELVEMDEAFHAGFEELHRENALPEEVICVVFDEREEADHWLELRHTGQNEGAGTVPWGAPEQNRFRRNRGSQTDAAMRFAEAMRSLYPDEIEFLQDVDKVESDMSTTLGRVIQNPTRKAQFGLEQKDGVMYVQNDPEDMLPLLERLFRDLASGTVNVTNLRDRDYLDNYMVKILREVPHDRHRLPKLTSVQDWVADQAEPEDAAADDDDTGTGDGIDSANRTRRQRRREEQHVFQGLVLSHANIRVSDVLREAQKLYIETSPNLAAIMLRVVLDLTSSSFYAHIGRSNSDNTDFKVKIKSCADKVDPKVDDPELRRARELIASDGALSFKTMNGYVHGLDSGPLIHDVRVLSAAYAPLLRKLDEYMRDHPKV